MIHMSQWVDGKQDIVITITPWYVDLHALCYRHISVASQTSVYLFLIVTSKQSSLCRQQLSCVKLCIWMCDTDLQSLCTEYWLSPCYGPGWLLLDPGCLYLMMKCPVAVKSLNMHGSYRNHRIHKSVYQSVPQSLGARIPLQMAWNESPSPAGFGNGAPCPELRVFSCQWFQDNLWSCLDFCNFMQALSEQ